MGHSAVLTTEFIDVMSPQENLQAQIAPLQEKLLKHSVYHRIKTPEDLRVFMEHHVYAVWDFMSLAKRLQMLLTCVETPWIPKGTPELRHFINEIISAEESDLDHEGNYYSHFEMYLNAMEDTGADTNSIVNFLHEVYESQDINQSVSKILNPSIRQFLQFTFDVIQNGKPHEIASTFTFGREDLIPSMFTELVGGIKKDHPYSGLMAFEYYLQRHIELDGDEHGPLALKMVEELCGDNPQKWEDATRVACLALESRINLWNGIDQAIQNHKQSVALV